VTEKGLSFGAAAELYDRRRPSYPDAAIDVALAGGPVHHVVEVGCGTGKATTSLAQRGLRITAIEPDAAMAAVARRNLPDVDVVVSRFEDWDGPADSADAVVSAQAWHWVDRSLGIPNAARVLRPGGRMAVMSNRPRDGGMDLRAQLEPVYESVAPGLVAKAGMLNWTGQYDEFTEEFQQSGLFDPEPLWHVDWDEPLDTQAFIELTQTHADFLVLDADQRQRLMHALAEAVDGLGGVVTMTYRTVVLVSRLARSPA
jgi:SAM-dependent methyltransferase